MPAGLPNLFSSGWHLHMSLIDRKHRINAFVGDAREGLSSLALNFLGGLLEHARAAAAFTTPTVNGYKRYRAYALAPDRVIWARDNRGVMVRVLGQPGDPSTHLENRVGEPAANPYLYMASQIYAGLDGMARASIQALRRMRPTRPMLRCCRRTSAKRSPRCAKATCCAKVSATPSSIITLT